MTGGMRTPSEGSGEQSVARARAEREANRLRPEDRPVHDWYRFVLSFPPHLVRDYLNRFGIEPGQRVLDPFCGTGTVAVECQNLGIAAHGVEANPFAGFAAAVKTDWSVGPADLIEEAEHLAHAVHAQLEREGLCDQPRDGQPFPSVPLRTLPPEAAALLPAGAISALPLHKALLVRDAITEAGGHLRGHSLLALAKVLVQNAANLHFGPEISVRTAKRDAAVAGPWLAAVRRMADDLHRLHTTAAPPAVIHHADARDLTKLVPAASIDGVITSPPYPNEKDYTRATRLELVVLGYVTTRGELRALKRGLLRSNSRGVYRDDADDTWISGHPPVMELAAAIEQRRLDLGKTSGFERNYARATRLYFGGMARHLAGLRPLLRPGARLAYVVGDQASFFRVLIRTGQILAGIAEELGYRVESIDLFRTRAATATGERLREEVVVLRWPG